MKIVYMGTPDFAVAPLEAIIRAGHEVTAVVTQPDKQKGRGKTLQITPVKECALKYNISVFQPAKIKEKEAVEKLAEYEADIFVIAAFGQFLSGEILSMPRFGCVNIHASLLPAYRGAAPIQWAIINGEEKTGVTIMQMEKVDRGVDTGDMLLKKEVPISSKETGESLHDKLMEAGAQLIVEALIKIEKGELIPQKQDDTKSSYAGRLTKAMGLIEWEKSAVSIERLIRGLNSWPSAYTVFNGKTLKIWEADVISEAADQEPGTITGISKDAITVAAGEGSIQIKSVQLEGKKRVSVKDFLLGYEVVCGTKLG